MEREQEREWAEAQKIQLSIDLADAAKKQLKFLAAVDRNRCLYEGPALQRAIYRYNAFWLPLLAKHPENPVREDPLVVPLDCEWIWHCHRINPIRYKLDCMKLFGRILDNHNVLSSVQETSKSRTEELWHTMYPEEPYELDLTRPLSEDFSPIISQSEKFTSYDLVSAVRRQTPFCFQVSRPHMSEDLFLLEAVARYKGFLHLIRTNKKKNIRCFCVPTYDIDLIWHSHQLHPVSYRKDMSEIVGKVLEHDDTDSDRTKGKKLDTGFSETTKQWEETFGLRYWKAGAMYRGTTPSPVTDIPFPFTFEGKKLNATNNFKNLIQFPVVKAVEVLLEIVEIKNLSEGHKGNLLVSFSKKQPDKLFNTKRTLSISESGEKQLACFQCERTGEFLLELISSSPSNIPIPKSFKSLGSCSFSLQESLASASQLSVDEWLTVLPVSGTGSSVPILHVSASFTIPTPAHQVFHLVQSQSSIKNHCLFQLPEKLRHAENLALVVDDDGNDVVNLRMRDLSKDMKKSNPNLLKEVYCITDSGEVHTLAEFVGNEWSVKGTHGSFKLYSNSENNGHLFELVGHKMVRLFPGRKLDFELKHCENKRSELEFVTAVEFSASYPYGRAAALIDLRCGTFKVKEEWMFLPGITVAFILSDILRTEEGYPAGITARGSNKKTGSCDSGCDGGCGGAVKTGASGDCGASCVDNSGGFSGCGGGKCGGGGGCRVKSSGGGGAVKTEAFGDCGASCVVNSGGYSGCGGGKCGGGGCRVKSGGSSDCGGGDCGAGCGV